LLGFPAGPLVEEAIEVQRNKGEHFLAARAHELPFLLEGEINLVIDPPARERGRGTTEQHFVPQPDTMGNLRVEVITRQHLVFIKPAANAPVLELVMQAVGEACIRMVVADEAGVELDQGISAERINAVENVGHLPSGEAWVMQFGGLNFPVIQTTAPDKGEGEWSGVREGVVVEGAWATVDAGL